MLNFDEDFSNSFGYFEDVHHCVYNKKSYVQLSSKTSNVTTVLLANRSDESLAELKVYTYFCHTSRSFINRFFAVRCQKFILQ